MTVHFKIAGEAASPSSFNVKQFVDIVSPCFVCVSLSAWEIANEPPAVQV